MYAAVPAGAHAQPGTTTVLSGANAARGSFCANGTIPAADDTNKPRAANDNWIVAAVRFDLGLVAVGASAQRFVVVAYDDLYSVQVNHVNLMASWRHALMPNADPAAVLLSSAIVDYAYETTAAATFDAGLVSKLTAAGGEQYASVAALAYRQTIGANKLVATADGTLLHLSRECGSGDDILTMDVVIDSAPFFLYFNTEYVKAELRPVLALAMNKTRCAQS